MNKATIKRKIEDGLQSQGWQVVGRGGTWAAALAPLLAYLGKSTKPAPELHPVDIYDFAGWLTTRPGKMDVGSSCEAGPMAEAVGEYLSAYPERFQAAPAAPAPLPPLPPIDNYLPTDGPRWTTANFIACVERYAVDYARAAIAASKETK